MLQDEKRFHGVDSSLYSSRDNVTIVYCRTRASDQVIIFFPAKSLFPCVTISALQSLCIP